MVGEYGIVFLSLVCSAIKTKPEDKQKIQKKKNTTNINATVLAVGCYYAVREALVEHQSICERSFVSAFFCARIFLSFFFSSQQHCSPIWDGLVIAVNSLLSSSYHCITLAIARMAEGRWARDETRITASWLHASTDQSSCSLHTCLYSFEYVL